MTGIARDAATTSAAVELAVAGDSMAFARIVATYHPDLIRVAFVVSGGNQDIADDAVQAAWSIAWRRLGTLRDPSRLKAWLVSVAANEARRLCRRQRSWRFLQADVVEIESSDRVRVDDPAERSDALDLEGALRRLTPDERALLAMRYDAGLDSSEIGALSGRPAATVRWRLARLRDRLRKELSDG